MIYSTNGGRVFEHKQMKRYISYTTYLFTSRPVRGFSNVVYYFLYARVKF